MGPQVFFGNPGSNVLVVVSFWAVFYLWAASELFLGYRLTRRGKSSGSVTSDSGSKWILISSIWVGVTIGFVLAVLAPSVALPQHRHVVFAAGIAMAVIGMALRWYSVWFLGRSFTCEVAVRPDQEVVDTGPYRLIRHPSYAGGLLTVLGLVLCLTNPLSLLGLLIAVAGYAYRIQVEERVLASRLGEPYVRYMRRTKRLIPFLV